MLEISQKKEVLSKEKTELGKKMENERNEGKTFLDSAENQTDEIIALNEILTREKLDKEYKLRDNRREL